MTGVTDKNLAENVKRADVIMAELAKCDDLNEIIDVIAGIIGTFIANSDKPKQAREHFFRRVRDCIRYQQGSARNANPSRRSAKNV
jgi:hypothetical protein